MAIQDLFDHRLEVWRPVETRGAYSEVVETFQLVHSPTRDNGALVPPKMRLQGFEPGEANAGMASWFLGVWVDVQARDVLRATSGPNAGHLWKVHSSTTPSGRMSLGVGGHHKEVHVEMWKGDPPDLSGSS